MRGPSYEAMVNIRPWLSLFLKDLLQSDPFAQAFVYRWFSRTKDEGPYDLSELFTAINVIKCNTEVEIKLHEMLSDLYRVLYDEATYGDLPDYHVGVQVNHSMEDGKLRYSVDITDPIGAVNDPNMYVFPIPKAVIRKIREDAVEAYKKTLESKENIADAKISD